MDSSTLFDAFQFISVGLDMSSIEVISKVMEKQEVNIVNLEEKYHLKEGVYHVVIFLLHSMLIIVLENLLLFTV